MTHLGTVRETFSPSVVCVCVCLSKRERSRASVCALVVFVYPDNLSSSFFACKTSMSQSTWSKTLYLGLPAQSSCLVMCFIYRSDLFFRQHFSPQSTDFLPYDLLTLFSVSCNVVTKQSSLVQYARTSENENAGNRRKVSVWCAAQSRGRFPLYILTIDAGRDESFCNCQTAAFVPQSWSWAFASVLVCISVLTHHFDLNGCHMDEER